MIIEKISLNKKPSEALINFFILFGGTYYNECFAKFGNIICQFFPWQVYSNEKYRESNV